jgi:hypothetical protein
VLRAFVQQAAAATAAAATAAAAAAATPATTAEASALGVAHHLLGHCFNMTLPFAAS